MTSAELVTIGINASLVLITGLYAFFTYQILQANQRVADEMSLQRRDMLRPILSIGPEIDDYLVLSLVIKNVGVSPATNLHLRMQDDFYRFCEHSEAHNLRTFSAFNSSIAALAPGAALRFDLAQGFNLGKEKGGKVLTPMQFKISANYDFSRTHYEEEFHIDLKPYMNSTVFRSKSADEMEKIRKALEAIANKRT